jgi:hypothetical protein
MSWYPAVLSKLRAARIFRKVEIVGSKIRATIDNQRFLDIHYDSDTLSYSYAVIDESLQYPNDKRVFGWDDFPHIGDAIAVKICFWKFASTNFNE